MILDDAIARRIIWKVELHDAVRIRHEESKAVAPLNAGEQTEQFAHPHHVFVVIVRAVKRDAHMPRAMIRRFGQLLEITWKRMEGSKLLQLDCMSLN